MPDSRAVNKTERIRGESGDELHADEERTVSDEVKCTIQHGQKRKGSRSTWGEFYVQNNNNKETSRGSV